VEALEKPASISSNGRYFQFKQDPGVIKGQFNSAESYGGKLPLGRLQVLSRIDRNPESCPQWLLLHCVMLEKGLGLRRRQWRRRNLFRTSARWRKRLARWNRGEVQMAGLLKTVRVEQVTEIALGGGVLPQKPTDFLSEAAERRGDLQD
jgi:hypothetical protein